MGYVCEDVPPDASVTVEVYNDDDLNLGIAEAFKEELVKRDYRVGEGQQYRIMMDSKIDLNPVIRPDLSLSNLEGNRRRIVLNRSMWQSHKEELRSRRRKGARQEEPRVVVTATLRDRETDKVLWRGEAEHAMGNNRPLKVGKALMPALAEAFRCTRDSDQAPPAIE